MNNEIRLLDASLLEDTNKLKEISYWLKVLNRPNGWHYDLDFIWILNELKANGVLPGSTIIDAGAGQGVMQYLLAVRGYNVISLDFSPRTKPKRSLGIFNIVGEGAHDIEYKHPYMRFISYGANPSEILARRMFKMANFRKMALLPQRIVRYAISVIFYLYERFSGSHDGYGTITYLRAPFHEVPLESESVDAVISVSAIEHADIDLFKQNVNELMRVLRPNAPLLLTTSASESDKNTYDEKTSGLCFSKDFLLDNLPVDDAKFDLSECIKSLKQSNIFRDRIDPYYYQDKESFCYKRRIENFPYLPVGIKLHKA